MINVTQAVPPIMQAGVAGGPGDIINIGGIAFTDALGGELLASRIHLMKIDPVQVETVGVKKKHPPLRAY